jgi:hypothetical protein
MADICSDREKKPDDDAIQAFFGETKFAVYQYLKSEMAAFGTPDLLWRGEEHGWALTSREANGRYGLLLLKQSEFVMFLPMSANQAIGISTDERLPEPFKDEINSFVFFSPERILSSQFIKIELNTPERIKSFRDLIALMVAYA